PRALTFPKDISALALMLRLPVAMWAVLGLLLWSALSGSDVSKPFECETCNASSTRCTGPMMTCSAIEDVCMTMLIVNVTVNVTVSTIEKRCFISDACFELQANVLETPGSGSISVNVTCTRYTIHPVHQDSGSMRLAPSGLSLWVVLWQLVAGGFGVACISVSLETILGLSKLVCLPLYVLRSEN
ncbi:hypothetical protein lerEdw1_009630, partial [Lerista edwardsae]